MEIIIKDIITKGPVSCNNISPGDTVALNGEYTFILDGCTLVEDAQSELIVHFHPITSSPELYRTAKAVFTLKKG